MAQDDIATHSYASHYVFLSMMVVVYYDYFLTLPREIERFWSQGSLTFASFLFYSNRYLAVLGYVPMMVEYFLPLTTVLKDPTPCLIVRQYHKHIFHILQLNVAVLLIMRVYALYDRSKSVLVMLGSFPVAGSAVGMWISTKRRPDGNIGLLSVSGCPAKPGTDQAARLTLFWAGNLLFDVVIFAMTFAKATRMRKGGSQRLLTVLLRDGSVYLIVMVIAAALNIALLQRGPPHIKSIFMTPANLISSTMCTRLLLNIRDTALTEPDDVSGDRCRYPCNTTIDGWDQDEFDDELAERGGARYGFPAVPDPER